MKKISEKNFYTNILPKSYENPDGGRRTDDRRSRRPLLKSISRFGTSVAVVDWNQVRLRRKEVYPHTPAQDSVLDLVYCTVLHCTVLYCTVLHCTDQDSVLDLVVGAPYTGAETLQYGGAVLVHLGTRAGGGYTLDTAASRCPIT